MVYYRVYQVANVKSEWNCIKTFPDLSGTGISLILLALTSLDDDALTVTLQFALQMLVVSLLFNIACGSSVFTCSNCWVLYHSIGAGKITSVKFGPDAKYVAVGSMDRNLRVFGLPEENDGPSET